MAKRKNDLILIAILLFVAGGIWIYTVVSRDAGVYAVVFEDGKETARYPLNEEITVRIGSGDRYNILVIGGGEAYVSEAGCPDGLCIGQGHIRFRGQSIICLPHKLVVEIAGGKESDIDTVAK